MDKTGRHQNRKSRTRHGLQGPIDDDAFMDSFIFVRPTGAKKNGRPSSSRV